MTTERRIKSFVKRASRMTPLQEKALQEYKHMILPYTEGKSFKMEDILPSKDKYVLEIGFGMGDATWQIAQNNPDKAYLGVEVHTPGVGKLLYELGSRNLDNMRVISHDVVPVLKDMEAEQLDGVHIFFPDPWPKKRHNKRRLIQSDFLKLLSSRVKTGGYIYFVTDWEDYAHWALSYFEAEPSLHNKYSGFADPQEWRPETKFENKGLQKQHHIFELYFIKNE
ncbi:tRNA (guanosine(46)-N7)-methyltransferase TrmB [Spirochaeta cellobiosiphila]|uniref:tRNA (guanosine(46)-N7)-methyltransferase TrmB n=1 Tax=Spirochaeta cellobiosiphila TaxID=504483 RepID=UPI00055DCBEA|nr:tRNA (guanosine(46)-N7)-methyltransferase TrmB [Spirochaeta cellobiosiphila]